MPIVSVGVALLLESEPVAEKVMVNVGAPAAVVATVVTVSVLVSVLFF